MRIFIAVVCLPLSLLAATRVAAQVPDVPEVSIGGRVQTQVNTSSMDDVPPSELFIRRARLELAVEVNDRISGVLNPDFAGNEVNLKDAFLNLAISPAFEIRAGQMHRPFGLLELTSSKRMPMVERGLRIRGLDGADEYELLNELAYSDRDIGIQLHGSPAGAPLGASYAVGVFRGPLHGSVGNRDSYQFAARGTVRLAPALRLGAGWSMRDFALGEEETAELRRGDAFEVDVEYGGFRPGAHVLAEVATGELDPFTDAQFTAAQAWLGYRTGSIGTAIHAIEPVLRVSHADSDAPDLDPLSGGTLFTPGINVYFGPLQRLMLNYDVWRGAGSAPDAGSFKAMFQLAF